MSTATAKEIARIFPDLPDHAISEIMAMQATINELDAALMLLSSDDVDLIETKQSTGDRINWLVRLLNAAGVDAAEDRDR